MPGTTRWHRSIPHGTRRHSLPLEPRSKTRCARRTQRRGPGTITGCHECMILLATVPRCQQLLRRGPARRLDDTWRLQHFASPVGHALRQIVEHSLLSGCQMGSGRKRWGSDARRRYADGYIVIADPAPRPQTGQPSRYHASRSKLAIEARTAIREARATGRSLRELAARYKVSHQTIANAFKGDAGA
jgi:hypothetical protein